MLRLPDVVRSFESNLVAMAFGAVPKMRLSPRRLTAAGAANPEQPLKK